MKQSKQEIYTCPHCGLHYRSKDIAQKCEAWCKEHHSCNLEIIKFAINESELKK